MAMFTSKFRITFFLILARLVIFDSLLQFFLCKKDQEKKTNLLFIIRFDKRQLRQLIKFDKDLAKKVAIASERC